METGKNRGLGDNSKNYPETTASNNADYQSLNPIDHDLVRSVKDLLWSAIHTINDADSEHRASHGDEFNFKDEVNEKESSDALGKVVFGVWRKPNTYEKKAFARDSEITMGKAKDKICKAIDLITGVSKND